jgi:hypothetical protein
MNSQEIQKELYKEVEKYNSEYKTAIKKLIEIENVNEILSPLTALIMQYIENELKAILQDYFEIKNTAKELNIDNHKCKDLLNKVKEKYKKYLTMDLINNQFTRIDECIDYLEAIYGENILINSRYPLNAKTLTISREGEKVISDEYKLMFTVLRYAIEHLVNFYQVEKVYQSIVQKNDARKQLNDFMDFLKKDDSIKFNTENVWLIKEIDKYNKNILKEGENE